MKERENEERANAALLAQPSFDPEALADGVEALQAAVRRRLAGKTTLFSNPVPLGGMAHSLPSAYADHAMNARHEVRKVLPKLDLSGMGSKLGMGLSKLGAAGNTSPRINSEPEPLSAPCGSAPGEQLGYSAATRDCTPVFVFINGLFDGGVAGPVRKHLRCTFPACTFLSLHCGAVSSVLDRAVECFWELRGGRVDYHVDGSVLEHGHGRYGESHPGLLPSWCADCPIHIFAFSLGATTARCLQHLLERGVFADKNGPISTSGAWYASPSWFCLAGCRRSKGNRAGSRAQGREHASSGTCCTR